MSCIPKLLELKGDKKYLPVCEQIVIEHAGSYNGFDYLITFNDMGHRCAYVALPPNHPTNNDESDYPDFDVHGGITFFQSHETINSFLENRCEDKWLGFDAGHHMDLRDIKKITEFFPNHPHKEKLLEYADEYNNMFSRYYFNIKPTVKDVDYMEDQCKSLIDQLIELENK